MNSPEGDNNRNRNAENIDDGAGPWDNLGSREKGPSSGERKDNAGESVEDVASRMRERARKFSNDDFEKALSAAGIKVGDYFRKGKMTSADCERLMSIFDNMEGKVADRDEDTEKQGDKDRGENDEKWGEEDDYYDVKPSHRMGDGGHEARREKLSVSERMKRRVKKIMVIAGLVVGLGSAAFFLNRRPAGEKLSGESPKEAPNKNEESQHPYEGERNLEEMMERSYRGTYANEDGTAVNPEKNGPLNFSVSVDKYREQHPDECEGLPDEVVLKKEISEKVSKMPEALAAYVHDLPSVQEKVPALKKLLEAKGPGAQLTIPELEAAFENEPLEDCYGMTLEAFQDWMKYAVGIPETANGKYYNVYIDKRAPGGEFDVDGLQCVQCETNEDGSWVTRFVSVLPDGRTEILIVKGGCTQPISDKPCEDVPVVPESSNEQKPPAPKNPEKPVNPGNPEIPPENTPLREKDPRNFTPPPEQSVFPREDVINEETKTQPEEAKPFHRETGNYEKPVAETPVEQSPIQNPGTIEHGNPYGKVGSQEGAVPVTEETREIIEHASEEAVNEPGPNSVQEQINNAEQNKADREAQEAQDRAEKQAAEDQRRFEEAQSQAEREAASKEAYWREINGP